MKQLTRMIFVASTVFTISAWGAENRIINMVDCTLNDGATMENVREANNRWVRYMNKNVSGGDIRSFLVVAVVGDWAPNFKFIDSFPSLASWSAMVEAERGEGEEIAAIMESLIKSSTCSGNTLHRAEQFE